MAAGSNAAPLAYTAERKARKWKLDAKLHVRGPEPSQGRRAVHTGHAVRLPFKGARNQGIGAFSLVITTLLGLLQIV